MFCVVLFQSLIGRLKTPLASAAWRATVAFQSLIGRLKTEIVDEFVDRFVWSFNPS